MDKAFIPVAIFVFGIVVGIIGFFLKRTISQQDDDGKRITALETCKASKDDLTDAKEEICKRTDKLAKDIEDIRADYITKEDFFREQAKTDRKLDMILDILLERKGAKNG